MAVLKDVARRHAFYLMSMFSVMILSDNWILCFSFLAACVYGLHWHSGTPFLFTTLVSLVFTISEIVMLSLSVKTMRYDYAIPRIGIPLWILPWWAVRAQWVLDIYCVCVVINDKEIEKDRNDIV